MSMSIMTPDLLPSPERDQAILARWHEVRARSLLSGVMRRWPLVATILSLAVIATSVALLYMRPLYTAVTVVQVGEPESQYTRFKTTTGGGDSPTDANVVAIILRTQRDVFRLAANDVVTALDLNNDPEFNSQSKFAAWAVDEARAGISFLARYLHLPSPRAYPTSGQEVERTAIINRVLKGLQIDADGRSYLLTAQYTASTPEKAMKIANEFAGKYLDRQVDAKADSLVRARDWINGQLEDARRRLTRAEIAVDEFRKANGVAEMGQDSVSIAEQQLKETNTDLVAAVAARAEAESKDKTAQALVSTGQTNSIPEVLSSPLVQFLRTSQTRVYLENGRSQALQEQINAETNRIVQSLSATAAASRTRVTELQRQVETLRREVTASYVIQFRLRSLEREVDANREFVKTMSERYEEVSALQHAQHADARVVSAATLPASPSSPNVALSLVLASAGAVMVSILLVLWLERRDNGFRLVGEVEAATNLPCLGILPDTGSAAAGHDTLVFAEAMRTIRSAISLTASDGPRIFLVTSSIPQEGKTVFAIALARALASAGHRTLLLDGDLRYPSIARLIGCPASDLRAIVRGEDSTPSSIGANLHVIASRQDTEGGQELVASRLMDSFIETARSRYDSIVIDSPPVAVVSDACVWARFADDILYMVRWGHTRRQTVAVGMKRLRDVAHTRLATILTRVDLARHSRDSPHGEGSCALTYGRRYYGNHPAT